MPTSYAVLDAGILLATVQTEPLTEQAQALMKHLTRENVQATAPTLLHYELVAVARKWVYRGLTTPEQAQRALNTLLRYPIVLHFDEALLRRGYELAVEFDRPTAYDAQYLALSERLNCAFWTTDERLFNAASRGFPSMQWLGNWTATAASP
jgi:predicted nucleic acid-binding protein